MLDPQQWLALRLDIQLALIVQLTSASSCFEFPMRCVLDYEMCFGLFLRNVFWSSPFHAITSFLPSPKPGHRYRATLAVRSFSAPSTYGTTCTNTAAKAFFRFQHSASLSIFSQSPPCSFGSTRSTRDHDHLLSRSSTVSICIGVQATIC